MTPPNRPNRKAGGGVGDPARACCATRVASTGSTSSWCEPATTPTPPTRTAASRARSTSSSPGSSACCSRYDLTMHFLGNPARGVHRRRHVPQRRACRDLRHGVPPRRGRRRPSEPRHRIPLRRPLRAARRRVAHRRTRRGHRVVARRPRGRLVAHPRRHAPGPARPHRPGIRAHETALRIAAQRRRHRVSARRPEHGPRSWTIAADAIGRVRSSRARVDPPEPDVGDDLALAQAAATFVTLERGEALLGCIGTLEAAESLAASVARNACKAAFADPRLPPVTAADFAVMTIKVSVLSRLSPVRARSWRDVQRAIRARRRRRARRSGPPPGHAAAVGVGEGRRRRAVPRRAVAQGRPAPARLAARHQGVGATRPRSSPTPDRGPCPRG